jgi:hypothetical protein
MHGVFIPDTADPISGFETIFPLTNVQHNSGIGISKCFRFYFSIRMLLFLSQIVPSAQFSPGADKGSMNFYKYRPGFKSWYILLNQTDMTVMTHSSNISGFG